MQKYLGILVIFGVLFGFNFVFAEESTETGASAGGDLKTNMRMERGTGIGADAKLRMEERKERRMEVKEKVITEKGTIEEKAKAAREAMMKKTDAAREALKEKRDKLKEKNEALREKAKQKFEELKSKVKDEKSERRLEGRDGLMVRFDAQVDKVVKFEARVNEVIAKFEAKGLNVSDAKTNVANANVKLEEAKGKITEINSLLATSVNELSNENKTKLKTLVKEAGVLLKDAYKELHLASQSLKNIAKAEAEAKTSVETESSESSEDSQ